MGSAWPASRLDLSERIEHAPPRETRRSRLLSPEDDWSSIVRGGRARGASLSRAPSRALSLCTYGDHRPLRERPRPAILGWRHRTRQKRRLLSLPATEVEGETGTPSQQSRKQRRQGRENEGRGAGGARGPSKERGTDLASCTIVARAHLGGIPHPQRCCRVNNDNEARRGLCFGCLLADAAAASAAAAAPGWPVCVGGVWFCACLPYQSGDGTVVILPS